MRSNQGLSSCSPLEAVSAWSSLHLQEHNKHQQQRRRRRLVSLAGSRVSMTLSAGAPLKEQDPASRSRPPSPSTSQGTHLDDFTYVAVRTYFLWRLWCVFDALLEPLPIFFKETARGLPLPPLATTSSPIAREVLPLPPIDHDSGTLVGGASPLTTTQEPA